MNREQWLRTKDLVLAGAAAAGSAAVNALGGWDRALQTLLFCMALDYLTGLVVAGVFRRSDKSGDGALDSRAGFRGLCKKGAELALVLVAVRLDLLVEETYARTAVLLFKPPMLPTVPTRWTTRTGPPTGPSTKTTGPWAWWSCAGASWACWAMATWNPSWCWWPPTTRGTTPWGIMTLPTSRR